MNEEMSAEKKIEEPGNARTPVLSDARNYLYIDYNVRTTTERT